MLHPGPVTPIELGGLALLCAAVVVGCLWAMRVPLLLGHDESVYALWARHWLADTPATGVSEHRAPLLSVIGLPVLALGGGDAALRGIGVIAAVGAAVAVWWLGRMMHGPITGLMAATVFALAPTVFAAGTLYLTDLPAAGVLVALAGLLWRQFALRERPGQAVLLAAPLAWAAYELRYGSALVVVLLFAVACVMFWPGVRGGGRRVLQTVALLALLLVPHLVNSMLDMGTPWQRLLYISRATRGAYLGEGLALYVRWFPRELAGQIAAALMTAGLVTGPVVWLRNLVQQRRSRVVDPHARHLGRVLAFLILPAVGHVVAIGLASHGEPRFVFFAVALLCVAGAVVVVEVLRRLADRSTAAVWVALVLFALGMAAHLARLAPSQAGERKLEAERRVVLLDAATALGDLSGHNCSVLTGYVPQITWYSGCESYHFGRPPTVGQERFLTSDAWMLLLEQGKVQPEGAVLDAYLAIADPVRTWDPPFEGSLGSGTLYRITTAGPDAGSDA